MRTVGRRRGGGHWLAALGLLAACAGWAGCAGAPEGPAGPEGDAVPRPEWKVGDRWVFQRTALSGAKTVVTHQVTGASGEGYTLRVRGIVPELTREWTLDLHLRRQAAGDGPAATFDPPASYFAWPLTVGKVWAQEFEYRDGRRDGRYANVWRVAGLESVHVLGGSFHTVRIEHRGREGERLQTYWYTPRARYWVKLESYVDGYTEELVELGG